MASALQIDSTTSTITDLEAAMVSQIDSTTSTITDLEAATVSQMVQSLCPWASPTRAQLARSFWATGSVTLVMGMTTAFHLPPAGPIFGPAVYYFTLVLVLAAAAVEMATAFVLLRSDGQRFHAFAKRLLPFAYLLLLVAVSASGFVVPFKI